MRIIGGFLNFLMLAFMLTIQSIARLRYLLAGVKRLERCDFDKLKSSTRVLLRANGWVIMQDITDPKAISGLVEAFNQVNSNWYKPFLYPNAILHIEFLDSYVPIGHILLSQEGIVYEAGFFKKMTHVEVEKLCEDIGLSGQQEIINFQKSMFYEFQNTATERFEKERGQDPKYQEYWKKQQEYWKNRQPK